jgi:hypothetical protein
VRGGGEAGKKMLKERQSGKHNMGERSIPSEPEFVHEEDWTVRKQDCGIEKENSGTES